MFKKLFNQTFYVLYNFHQSATRFLIMTIISLLLVLLATISSDYFTDASGVFGILILPFKLIGDILRGLSLSGVFGNVIAVMLFIILSLIPLGIFFITLNKNQRSSSDRVIDFVFYLILSILVNRSLYFLINPSLIKNQFTNIKDGFESLLSETSNSITPEMYDYILSFQKIINIGIVFLMVCFVLIYLGYRFYFLAKHKQINLFQASNTLLWIQKVFYIILYLAAFYVIPITIKQDFKSLSMDSVDRNHIIFLNILRYLFLYTVIVLFAFILRRLHDLLLNFLEERLFFEHNVFLLQRTSLLFIVYLFISLVYQFINNAYQILFCGQIQSLHLNFELSLTPIILALVFYLLSLLMRQSYKIYKENSLTI